MSGRYSADLTIPDLQTPNAIAKLQIDKAINKKQKTFNLNIEAFCLTNRCLVQLWETSVIFLSNWLCWYWRSACLNYMLYAHRLPCGIYC